MFCFFHFWIIMLKVSNKNVSAFSPVAAVQVSYWAKRNHLLMLILYQWWVFSLFLADEPVQTFCFRGTFPQFPAAVGSIFSSVTRNWHLTINLKPFLRSDRRDFWFLAPGTNCSEDFLCRFLFTWSNSTPSGLLNIVLMQDPSLDPTCKNRYFSVFPARRWILFYYYLIVDVPAELAQALSGRSAL